MEGSAADRRAASEAATAVEVGLGPNLVCCLNCGGSPSILLEGAPQAAVRLVGRLEDLLEQLVPARLDPARCTVSTGLGRPNVFLAHITEPIAEIDINFSEGSGTMLAVNHHNEFYSPACEPSDQWASDIVEAVAEILQGHYVIEVARGAGAK